MTQDNFYRKLRNIKRPVLIIVKRKKDSLPLMARDSRFRLQLTKVRILYPDGNCEYSHEHFDKAYFNLFHKSCFAWTAVDLNDTVSRMKKFDKEYGCLIHEVIEL